MGECNAARAFEANITQTARLERNSHCVCLFAEANSIAKCVFSRQMVRFQAGTIFYRTMSDAYSRSRETGLEPGDWRGKGEGARLGWVLLSRSCSGGPGDGSNGPGGVSSGPGGDSGIGIGSGPRGMVLVVLLMVLAVQVMPLMVLVMVLGK